jgi:hypothetical protein
MRLRAQGLQQALDASASTADSLRDQLESERHRVAAEQETRAYLEAELARARGQLADLGNRLDSRTGELASIKASISWRVTRPLRWLSASHGWVRSLRRTFRALRNVEQSRPKVDLIASSGLFDRGWYLEKNPDVPTGVDPVLHYLQFGGFEGRDPNPLFDSDWYLSRYPDVAIARVNPLLHYIERGASEGRQPSASFDTERYLLDNPDVVAARMNPLAHYLQRRRLPPSAQ